MTNKKIICSYSLLAVLGITVFIYFYSGSYIPQRLDSQINEIIKNHDVKTMKKIASNNETFHLLENTTRNERVRNTSDSEGGNSSSLYYTTRLGNHNINVVMSKIGVLTWQVVEISK